MTRLEAVESLRKIADFLEQHPELDSDFYSISIQIPQRDTKDKIAELARLFGKCHKGLLTDDLYISHWFGKGEAWGAVKRDKVCRKVGTKLVTIPAMEAQPEKVFEEDIWECEPILAGQHDPARNE